MSQLSQQRIDYGEGDKKGSYKIEGQNFYWSPRQGH